MPKIPYILPTQQIQGPVGQPHASDDDFVPNVRQIRQSMEGTSSAIGSLGSAEESVAKGANAVGEGITKVGDVLQEREEQQEMSDLTSNVSQAHGDLTNQLKTAREHATPGDTAFASRFLENFDQYSDRVKDQATTFKGQQYLQRAFSEMRSTFAVSAFDAQSNLATEKFKQNMTQGQSALTGAAMDNPNAASFQFGLKQIDATIDGSTNYPGFNREAAEKMRFENKKELAKATLEGWANINPQYLQKILAPNSKDFDAFAPYVNSDVKEEMIGKAQRSIAFQDAEAARTQRVAKEKSAQQSAVTEASAINMIATGQPGALRYARDNTTTGPNDGKLGPGELLRIYSFSKTYAKYGAEGKGGDDEKPTANSYYLRATAPNAFDPGVKKKIDDDARTDLALGNITIPQYDKIQSTLNDKNIYGDQRVKRLFAFAQADFMAHPPMEVRAQGTEAVKASADSALNGFILHVLPGLQKDLASDKYNAATFESEKSPYYQQVKDFRPDATAARDLAAKRAAMPNVPEQPGMLSRAMDSFGAGIQVIKKSLAPGPENSKSAAEVDAELKNQQKNFLPARALRGAGDVAQAIADDLTGTARSTTKEEKSAEKTTREKNERKNER